MNNRIGEKNINNFGSEMIITGYRNNKDIDIYFPEYDWTFKHAQYPKFKQGNIKCPYEPRTCGVGYIGEGEYKSKINNKTTEYYKEWHNLIARCYDDNTIKRRPTYKNCIISKEWLNFQNFSEWYNENYYKIQNETMCLDKDILIKNNKIYSSNTCIFVPNRINLLFIKSDKLRGELPVGVHYVKRNKKYRAQCSNGKESTYLGLYNTPKEAFEVYKTYKEKLIKEVAEEYKNQIPNKLYRALLNYKIEIND